MRERTYVQTDDFVRNKIGCIDNQIFLPMVLRYGHRELHYLICLSWANKHA